mmetsp:Transcript_74622/g.177643  ORF Transcript_74622/g.177643 Transcript_74622/m.177643 type:complete len:104 (+) Transcript_74622:173-484(+)
MLQRWASSSDAISRFSDSIPGCVDSKELPVCLVSSHVHEFMAANIATATQALTAEEESAIEFLKKNIFSRLGKCTWEGIEVAKYRRKLAEKKAAAESAAPTPQ